MIRLQLTQPSSVEDVQSMLQTAIGVEFGTLPPYLYAMLSIPPGENLAAAGLVKSVALQEMIHMCLAGNILNAIGGSPKLSPPVYPGPLPGDIGPPDGPPLTIRLLRLSEDAMAQGMAIETPEDVPPFPVRAAPSAKEDTTGSGTIAQFYQAIDVALRDPSITWYPDRNQITDDQFFAGQLFAVNNYADAHRAIEEIVSEGEGSPQTNDPLDFQNEIAHYYRFGEVYYNKVLTKIPAPPGYAWGPEPLGVDWDQVYPAIPDPGTHDFSNDSQAAQDAQAACNRAYSAMVDALQLAMNGVDGQLGIAVRAMFDLRMAAKVALHIPLADGTSVAGPSFLYVSPPKTGGCA
ncbi:MAG TPA: ferritin-like protein [Allosphingosinicella sp.]|nr:ferritin-like protein [Allosphingosinicella sp.]